MGTSSLDLPIVWKDWKGPCDTNDTWRQSRLLSVKHVLHLRLQLPFHRFFLKNLWQLKARFHCRNFRGILQGRGHWCMSPLQEMLNRVPAPGQVLRWALKKLLHRAWDLLSTDWLSLEQDVTDVHTDPSYSDRSEQNQNVTWAKLRDYVTVGIHILLGYYTMSAPSMFTYFFLVFIVIIFASGSPRGWRHEQNCCTPSNGHAWCLWKVLPHSGDSTIEGAKWEEQFL